MTTFRNIHPIDCHLFNQDGQPLLYISERPDQELILQVRNASGKAMQWTPIFGATNQNNHHLALRFRREVLLSGTYDITLSESSAQEWESKSSPDGQTLYLTRIADDFSFPVDGVFEITLENMAAGAGKGVYGTRVGLKTNRLAYLHSPDVDMESDRTIYLGIEEETSIPENDGHLKQASILLNLIKGEEIKEGLSITLADDTNVEYMDTAEKKYEYLLRLSNVSRINDTNHDLQFRYNSVSPAKSSRIRVFFHQQVRKAGGEYPEIDFAVRSPKGWSVSRTEGDEPNKSGWVLTPEDTVELKTLGDEEDILAQRIEIPIRHLPDQARGYFTVQYENVPGHFDGQQFLAIDLEVNPPKMSIPILPHVHMKDETDTEAGEEIPTEEHKAREIQWTGAFDGRINIQTQIETHATLTFRKSAPSGFKVKTSGDWTVIVPSEASSARMQVYKKQANAWQLHQQLVAPQGTWGGGAALDGEWLAVTAHDAKGIGKIVFYQLQEDQWIQKQSLSASKANNWFGEQVTLFEGRAVVGAKFGGSLSAATGQATTYDLVGDAWVQGELLSPTTGKDFGGSVALNKHWALVGSQSLQGFQQENGHWQEKQQLVNEEAEKDRRFSALDASGNQLIAGAMADEGKSKQAFLFQEQNGQWQQMQQLQLPTDLDRPGLMGGINAIGQD